MKRIAMIMPGGVANADKDLHIPALYDLVSRLSSSFDITVYSLITFGNAPDTSRCGNAVVKIISAHHRDHWTKKMFLLYREFARDHRKNNFHLIHGLLGVTTELTAVLLAKFYRLPSVISLLGGETANIKHLHYGALYSRRLRLLTRFICREADVLTVLTKFQAEELRNHHMRRTHIPVIPFGVDTLVFNSNGKRAPREPYRFLHVANIIPLKDQETLLHAFKLISEKYEAHLKIIGSDHSQGGLPKKINDLGIEQKVDILGYLPHRALVEHYQWADVLLHTSLHEAQGVVVAEAAATHTLIAGTDVGLIADFNGDKAIAVAPGDYKTLASKICDALSSPSSFAKMRDQALAWAEEYTIKKTVEGYQKVYEGAFKQ